MPGDKLSPAQAVEFESRALPGCPESVQTLAGAFRQNWMRERGDDAQQFGGAHRIVPRRCWSASESPRAQGCSVVRYLSAAAMIDQINSSAREKSKFS